jgi:CRP-like cAMP-binding protein
LDLAEMISILAKADIFSTLPEEDLKRLGELLKPKECVRREIVILQGEFGDFLYYICRGEVEVFTRNQEGAESVVAHLREGDFFAEMALLTSSPRSASVKVEKDFFVLAQKMTLMNFLRITSS